MLGFKDVIIMYIFSNWNIINFRNDYAITICPGSGSQFYKLSYYKKGNYFLDFFSNFNKEIWYKSVQVI